METRRPIKGLLTLLMLVCLTTLVHAQGYVNTGYDNGQGGSSSNGNGGSTSTPITAADKGVLYSQGANNPVTTAADFYYDYTAKVLHAPAFETPGSNAPQTDFWPNQPLDTSWTIGVRADGQNTNNDPFLISEGQNLNANNRMTIIPGGNVGLGTALPGALLDVQGTVRALGITLGGVTNNTWPAGGSSQWITQAGNVGITTTSNVGIGSVTPGALLDVQGTLRAVGISLGGVTNTSWPSGSISGLTTSFVPRATGGTTIANGSIFDNGTNLGIGSVTPGQLLDVKGTVRLVGTGDLWYDQATKPTVALNACGSSTQGTVDSPSTDMAGSVTLGTTSVTSCAVTFNKPQSGNVICVCMNRGDIGAVQCTMTGTNNVLTMHVAAGVDGDHINWICVHNANG